MIQAVALLPATAPNPIATSKRFSITPVWLGNFSTTCDLSVAIKVAKDVFHWLRVSPLRAFLDSFDEDVATHHFALHLLSASALTPYLSRPCFPPNPSPHRHPFRPSCLALIDAKSFIFSRTGRKNWIAIVLGFEAWIRVAWGLLHRL